MKKLFWSILAIMLMGCTNTSTDKTNAAADSITNEVATPVEEESQPTLELTDEEAIALSRAINESDEEGAPLRELSDEEAAALARANARGVDMSLWGFIGGSHANLDMNGLTGIYSYGLDNGEVRRRLEFESWDKESGRVVLRAYELKSDKFIGKFDGTFVIENVLEGEVDNDGMPAEQWVNTYDGVFTNYKGAKTEFHLWAD